MKNNSNTQHLQNQKSKENLIQIFSEISSEIITLSTTNRSFCLLKNILNLLKIYTHEEINDFLRNLEGENGRKILAIDEIEKEFCTNLKVICRKINEKNIKNLLNDREIEEMFGDLGEEEKLNEFISDLKLSLKETTPPSQEDVKFLNNCIKIGELHKMSLYFISIFSKYEDKIEQKKDKKLEKKSSLFTDLKENVGDYDLVSESDSDKSLDESDDKYKNAKEFLSKIRVNNEGGGFLGRKRRDFGNEKDVNGRTSAIPSAQIKAAEEMPLQEIDEQVEVGESAFNEQINISQSYEWANKYKPEKPKYSNKVRVGYEWNKYNQAHYNSNNPPPKIIQGYRFNIFYPNLIDRTKTPKLSLERSEEESMCILKFKAGPPYEDIAFKIVNREWDLSEKSGYKNVFEKGVLKLYFRFKRYKYKR